MALLIALALFGAACGGSATGGVKTAAARDAALRTIAADYSRTGDLPAARGALDKLALANPAQLLISLGEQSINDGRPAAEIASLANLADALGARSPRLIAYLAPTATLTPAPPTTTPLPPSPTPLPPTATRVPATPTPEMTAIPPTATATPTSQKPRLAVEQGEANLRGGPGTNYGLIGRLPAGREVEIIGRNPNGDWWRIAWEGVPQAWVAGLVVKVRGPIDAVPVAQDIPAPPPTFTPAPPTATPKPAIAYTANVRLKSVGEDAQWCNSGDHSIFVVVVDAANNPLDGVRVREVFSGKINVTGAQGKGSGRVEFDIYRGGGGQVEVIDEANNRLGELSRGMSADWPEFDLMKAAGYCNCKPHPDDASCQADMTNKTYFFAVGHYSYVVVFRRSW